MILIAVFALDRAAVHVVAPDTVLELDHVCTITVTFRHISILFLIFSPVLSTTDLCNGNVYIYI